MAEPISLVAEIEVLGETLGQATRLDQRRGGAQAGSHVADSFALARKSSASGARWQATDYSQALLVLQQVHGW